MHHRPAWLHTGQLDSTQGSLTPHRAAWLHTGQLDSTQGSLTPHRAAWLHTGQLDSTLVDLTPYRAAWLHTGGLDSTQGSLTPHRAAWLHTGQLDSTQGSLTPHRAAWLHTGQLDSTLVDFAQYYGIYHQVSFSCLSISFFFFRKFPCPEKTLQPYWKGEKVAFLIDMLTILLQFLRFMFVINSIINGQWFYEN